MALDEPAPVELARFHHQMRVGSVLDPATVDAVAARASISRSDLVTGAGFINTSGRLVRASTLPDVVGPGMELLVIGLNPSPAAASAGVSFARPGNRFWPAALAGGLVSRDRDPHHALTHHGIGFTDIVKRTTRTAAELTVSEYRAGMARVERLARWLQPRACAMVGLAGWRAAVDRKATAGWQPGRLGGAPVYLMPSTSGLNARSSLDELTRHLLTAAGREPPPSP